MHDTCFGIMHCIKYFESPAVVSINDLCISSSKILLMSEHSLTMMEYLGNVSTSSAILINLVIYFRRTWKFQLHVRNKLISPPIQGMLLERKYSKTLVYILSRFLHKLLQYASLSRKTRVLTIIIKFSLFSVTYSQVYFFVSRFIGFQIWRC